MNHSWIDINIKNKSQYKVNLTYNDDSTFDDLLEYVSYNLSNICPCYKFFFNKNYGRFYDDEKNKKEINGNEKIYKYLRYKENYLKLSIPNGECKCNKYLKKFYNKSKIDIINYLKEIDEEKNSYKNELDSLKNNDIISNYLKNEEEMKGLEKDNANNEKRKVDLNNKIAKFNNKLQNCKHTENELKEKIKELKEQIEEFNKDEKLYKVKENELNEEIEKLNIQMNINNQRKREFQYKEIQLNKEIKQLKDQIDNYNAQEEIINKKKKKLNKTKENLNDKKSIIEMTHNQLKIDTENGIIIGNEKPGKDKKSFTNFYDVIIEIKSIKDINKGWKIKMSKKGETNYNKYKNEKIIKLGVIGNSNKGKSFLLSKISKYDLPSGYSIKTEGLSIKYPELEEYKNRKIALLDSAGLETPVLNEENYEKKNRADSNSQENILAENNTIEKDFFKEKSREKLITELFLQNYIINNSDILIIVIGILTYSEQKLLNKIKTEIAKTKKKNKNNIDKPLILIIHNLMTYTLIEQIEEYIQNILKQCSTFTLIEGHKTSTSKEIKKGTYFYEESNELKIFHLIYANEGSEAGNYYNNFTLNYIEQSYQNIINLTSFDVMETIKERFISISQDIIENTEDKSKIEFEKNDNKLPPEHPNATESCIIKLKNPSEVTLKKCFIDELGFSNLKANGFEPTYNYYIKDNQYLILKIEAPGKTDIKAIVDEEKGYRFIRLSGNKRKDKEPKEWDGNNASSTREFGEFFINIPLKLEPNILIKNSNPNFEQKLGLIIVKFELDKKSEGGTFITKDDDDL